MQMYKSYKCTLLLPNVPIAKDGSKSNVVAQVIIDFVRNTLFAQYHIQRFVAYGCLPKQPLHYSLIHFD